MLQEVLSDYNKMQSSFADLLGQLTKSLEEYLSNLLPSLSASWWQTMVVNKLSYQQQRRVEQKGIDSLSSLDLASLLRVFDQNWYEISTKLKFSRESRHFLKEMQTVRNRWAHASPDGFPVDDIYRNLDTVQRFAEIIDSEKNLIKKIKRIKSELLKSDTPSYPDMTENEGQANKSKRIDAAEFEPGQIILLKANPDKKGAVVSVIPSSPENRYNVFIDGEIRLFYASQIRAETETEQKLVFFPSARFHSYLTSLYIRWPSLSNLYSLNAARIDFIPYQFRPVLKFIRSDRPRLLIADSVGVGKTIEAGLILQEIQARRDIQSILIICPRPLVTERKWEIEMKRFEERFTHLDGKTLRYCLNEMDLDGVWPEQYSKIIIPYSLFDERLLYGSKRAKGQKIRRGLLDLDPPPKFDLVIVDEAHHIRNQETFSHRAVRFFCDHAEAVIFLTATPIQLGSEDLFTLLNVLRPDLILDQESFQHMSEPNSYINQAVALAREQSPGWPKLAAEVLTTAAETSWGRSILANNPMFREVHNRLSQGKIDIEERVKLINKLEGLHTFSGMINRTRRRDIGTFTVRKPETVIVDFTPAQKQLHDDILNIQTEVFTKLHGNVNVKFMMTTIRRQAASCLFGLNPFLEDILNRHLDDLLWDEADSSGQVPGNEDVNEIESKIRVILDNARALDPYDPKLEGLRKIIEDKKMLPNKKIMVFSSFRHTLLYLFDKLRSEGHQVGMIHGGTPDEERVELRARFEITEDQDGRLDILLFSEVGCEGLDYQFCDCIVNYDLPWNPMRVEQRIGRIDRKGQRSDTVGIFNLITPGTVDADIYERCLLRIGVFNNALGGSEEILGEITNEIRAIAENFSLSEEDRKIKLQQLADNKIRLIREQEELEQRQLELFGIRFPEEQIRKEIEEASNFWLSSFSLRKLITVYLQQKLKSDQEFILGEKPLKTLRLSQEARDILLQDFRYLPRQQTSIYREWENWLKGGDPHLSLTFDAKCASETPKADFIMPLHPLVRQAAMAFKFNKGIITKLSTKSKDVTPDVYKFVIYQWRFHGIRDDFALRPVSSSPEVTEKLIELLEKSEGSTEDNLEDMGIGSWEDLESQHYDFWIEARNNHKNRTLEIAQYRRESLTTSHHARISLIEEQLEQANDDKIRRMRKSQLAAAEADFARRMQELDIATERADITSQPVAYGLLEVVGDV
ncbi:MAG: Swt1 family HEPN domain-containing protein [Deltaproteobacteria bacterium]|nr:Swt1 family HEPN domain-containing protein [Deltaproteobacteria bacterium]